MAATVLREVNVGRITGLSSYELAVKYGYTGTEEEYVKREEKLYNDMVTLAEKVVGFSELSCEGSSITSTVGSSKLNINTDGNLEVRMDDTTKTMTIGLSEAFKKAIAYSGEKANPTVE